MQVYDGYSERAMCIQPYAADHLLLSAHLKGKPLNPKSSFQGEQHFDGPKSVRELKLRDFQRVTVVSIDSLTEHEVIT
jgi:hypothetical protein